MDKNLGLVSFLPAGSADVSARPAPQGMIFQDLASLFCEYSVRSMMKILHSSFIWSPQDFYIFLFLFHILFLPICWKMLAKFFCSIGWPVSASDYPPSLFAGACFSLDFRLVSCSNISALGRFVKFLIWSLPGYFLLYDSEWCSFCFLLTGSLSWKFNLPGWESLWYIH